MRDGAAWTRLRQLLDVAQDTSLISYSLDAHAASTGQLKDLATRGSEALRNLVAKEVLSLGDTFVDPQEVAYLATRDAALAQVFASLGLDARLRRHSRPLRQRTKADVVRVIAGEVERARGLKTTQSEEAFWRQELLWGLAGAALQVYSEAGPRRPRSSSGIRGMPGADAKLASLLHSGSARAIIGRMRAMTKVARSCLELRGTIAMVLPRMRENQMRLLVFMQVLQVLCQQSATVRGRRAESEHATLVSSVVDGVLAAGLDNLPFESAEQAAIVCESPYLSGFQRQALADLMLPADARAAPEPDCRLCGETGLDAYGKMCDCPYGQRWDARSASGSPVATQAPTLMPNALDAAPGPLNVMSRPLGAMPRPILSEPVPADPLTRPSSPASQATSLASPSQRPLSPASRGTSVYLDGALDPRPRTPYNDEGNLRPWMPLETQWRCSETPSRQRWVDDVPLAAVPLSARSLPFAAVPLSARSLSAHANRDDRVLTTLCRQSPSRGYVGTLPMHQTGIGDWRGSAGYVSPRRGWVTAPSTPQEMMDDRTLKKLCGEDFATVGPYNGIGFASGTYKGADYSARLASAASRFRTLAATFENCAVGSELDLRTAELLHTRPVW